MTEKQVTSEGVAEVVTEKALKKSSDPEMVALKKVKDAIDLLDPEAARRVLAYHIDRCIGEANKLARAELLSGKVAARTQPAPQVLQGTPNFG